MIKFYCDICNKDITNDIRLNLEIRKSYFNAPELDKAICEEYSKKIKTYIDNISKE